MADNIFAEGFYFKRREDAPEFVIGRLSIKLEDAIPFLEANVKNGYVNLNVLKSRETGSPYMTLDTYEPDPNKARSGGTTAASNKPTQEGMAKPKRVGIPAPKTAVSSNQTLPQQEEEVNDLPF